MLGTRTQGSSMEGTDESTDLCQHPKYTIFTVSTLLEKTKIGRPEMARF